MRNIFKTDHSKLKIRSEKIRIPKATMPKMTKIPKATMPKMSRIPKMPKMMKIPKIPKIDMGKLNLRTGFNLKTMKKDLHL
jgi:hypothetical protein